jgi:hypothetical protein
MVGLGDELDLRVLEGVLARHLQINSEVSLLIGGIGLYKSSNSTPNHVYHRLKSSCQQAHIQLWLDSAKRGRIRDMQQISTVTTATLLRKHITRGMDIHSHQSYVRDLQ